MDCKDAVLPEPQLKNCSISCLTSEENTRQPYNDNLCLFRALALHLHGNQRLEEKSVTFNLFINRVYGLSPYQFQGVHMNIEIVEDLPTLKIQLYDLDFVDGKIIGELARRSVQNYGNTVRLLRYNNHKCCVSDINAVFNLFIALIVTLFSKEHSIWSDIHLHTVNEKKYYSIQGTYIKPEKLSLTTWTLLVSSIQVKKTLQKLSNFRFRIDLCPGRDLQR